MNDVITKPVQIESLKVFVEKVFTDPAIIKNSNAKLNKKNALKKQMYKSYKI